MDRALGRYELMRPLARGGMAEVFLARRRAAGVEKLLVIKRIRPERANDAEFLDLFIKEARLSMSLAHQNIVPVFDFGRVGDQVYIAMERVEGKDLGSTLGRGARLSPLVAAFITSECCQALDYAHRREREGEHLKIVHRDVTPRNVLLSWSGEVKLTDFGIAALAGDATTKLLGTPAYMAPEQARREPVDARADLYAIGLVLREMLTGERPRRGADREAILEIARTGELPPWPEGVPPALRAIVERATAIAPADRYPDAREMLAELDDYMVAARAATRGEPPVRQLAALLAATWEGVRDDDGDRTEPDARFESFFDDAIGTGTQRSMAATAADEPAPPVAKPEPERAPTPLPVAQPTSRARWIAPILVIAASVVIVVVVTRDRSTPGTPPAPIVMAPAIDAAPVVEPIDAVESVIVDAAVPVDAAAPPPDAPPRITIKRPPIKPPDPPPPVVLRNVTINAKPWAHFTVDGNPTVHQTMKTLQLPPGPHTIKFTNPVLGVERTVVIQVPADKDLRYVEDLQ